MLISLQRLQGRIEKMKGKQEARQERIDDDERDDYPKEKPTEMNEEDFFKAVKAERAERESSMGDTPQLGMDDINQTCTIRRRYRHKSTFEGKEFYYSALLSLKDGQERWKTLNGWDLEAIATGAKEFKVATEKYKGAFKLVLRPLGGGSIPLSKQEKAEAFL